MGATLAALAVLAWAAPLHAEDGAAGWLRYAPVKVAARLPARIVALDSAVTVHSAEGEMRRALLSMTGLHLSPENALPHTDSFVLGTVTEVERQLPSWRGPRALKPDGYVLDTVQARGHVYWIVAGSDARGVLYGSFALLERLGEHPELTQLHESSSPSAAVRWVNQWDNIDGSIERGYAGRSIFFEGGQVRADMTRAGEYARLLASVGIDGCTVNNVNASLLMLSPQMIAGLARIADAFRPWGVRLSISVDLGSPKGLGGLSSFDPLDPQVIRWWQQKVDAIYRQIPDFAGFTVKADSEGQPGPSQYGRSPAAAANMLARALKPHGGIVMYRAFVYNHHLDWHDPKADRARAAYDIFHPLDGQFDDNVVVQIKNGPIDFQVREPASPLFAGLRHTNEAIELQITQEYTGQQRQLVYLVPMWKTTLDFDMRAENRSTPVKSIVEGESFDRPLGGYAGVANVGLDTNWMAHPLAMANLFGFGQLAWNPDQSSAQIAENWTRLTFGNNPKVVATIDAMLLPSWRVYEDYAGPLGLGTLTDILHSHYGPGIESAEHNGWGQWLRASRDGIGVDRTVATGTGFIGQYPPEVASLYESLATCPDKLLLFMHHVPYTHRLHNGETLVQDVYDSHYRGAERAQKYVDEWSTLRGLIDPERFDKVMALQVYQAGYAIVWRDAVTRWFYRMSGIADAKGRVDHYPDRIEAEAMQLDGYSPIAVTPWEDASGSKAVVCRDHAQCSASAELNRSAGTYDIAVQYFDLRSGASTFEVMLNGKEIGRWTANGTLPFDQIGGDTSTRYTVEDVPLKPGDKLTVIGHPNGGEPAPLDYVAIYPASAQSGLQD
jgi:alpha-glucuronidase